MIRSIILSICLGAVCYAAAAHEKQTQSVAGTQQVAIAQERLTMTNLPVTDRWGHRSGFRDAIGSKRSLILSFSYTACESLCSVTNAILSAVDKGLATSVESDVLIVTVGIDAVRDSPDALRTEAETFSASKDWLWLTGGPKGTRPLLESLRFPPGALEDHDPIFLVGRPCRGVFTRLVGIPDPDYLIALANMQPRCDG